MRRRDPNWVLLIIGAIVVFLILNPLHLYYAIYCVYMLVGIVLMVVIIAYVAKRI